MTNSKKLQFGAKKCKKLHVGHVHEEFKCQDLSVEKWTEVEVTNDVTGESEIKDIWDGEENIEETTEEKYLGDIISTDGKNIKNIKARIPKGQLISEMKFWCPKISQKPTKFLTGFCPSFIGQKSV